MSSYIFIVFLIIILIAFIIYEFLLHKRYIEDLEKEKQISDFTNTRMQIIRMLHSKELSKDSLCFRFMLQATSYGIRILYFYNNKEKALKEIDFLGKILPTLVNEDMKNEFKELSLEQKILLVKTILNVLALYSNENFEEKLLLKFYLKNLKTNVYKFLYLFKILLNSKTKEKISYYDDINSTYDLKQYALS